MQALTEVRSGLPAGGTIDLVDVQGGVRIRATYRFRHRLDGVMQYQTVGSDPYRVYGPADDAQLGDALRDARVKIDAKARLQSLAK